MPDEAGMHSLVCTLNRCAVPNALEDRILERTFKTYWPQFRDDFAAVLRDIPSNIEATPRKEVDILSDILNSIRDLGSRVSRLDSIVHRIQYNGVTLPVGVPRRQFEAGGFVVGPSGQQPAASGSGSGAEYQAGSAYKAWLVNEFNEQIRQHTSGSGPETGTGS